MAQSLMRDRNGRDPVVLHATVKSNIQTTDLKLAICMLVKAGKHNMDADDTTNLLFKLMGELSPSSSSGFSYCLL